MPDTPFLPGEPTRVREGEIVWFEPIPAHRSHQGPAAATSDAAAVQYANGRAAGARWRATEWVGFAAEPKPREAPKNGAEFARSPSLAEERASPPGPDEPDLAQIFGFDDPPYSDGPAQAGPGLPVAAAAELRPLAGAPRQPQQFAAAAASMLRRRGGQAAAAGRRIGVRIGSVASWRPASGMSRLLLLIHNLLGALRHRSARLLPWNGAPSRRLLRLGAALALLAGVAVFSFAGGDRLAGLAGAMTRSAASDPASGHAAAPGSPIEAQQASLPASSEPDRTSAAAEPGPNAAAALAPPPGESGGLATPLPPDGRIAAYLAAAETGDAAAQYDLGVLYAAGDGVTRNLSSAAMWFRQAASHGNISAQFNLGVMYERGLGVEPDMDAAIGWYRRAADQQHRGAEFNLAVAYAEGRGTAPDMVAAAGWYRRAAEQGVVPAMVNYAILYETGQGLGPSLADAYAWYRAAARRGDAAAEQRARDLFGQFTGPEKGQAVMRAAAIAEQIAAVSADAAPPAPVAEPPATLLKPSAWSARGPRKPARQPAQPQG